MNYSSSGPKGGWSQKLSFSLFLLLNSLLNPKVTLFLLHSVFSYVKMGEKGGGGINLSSTVCALNLADIEWQIGFTLCFNIDLLTAVSWSAVLRVLRRLSKSVSVYWVCLSWKRKEGVRVIAVFQWVVHPVFLLLGIDDFVLDQES